MENMVIDTSFWKNRKVLLTGHTGFKGGWLALWLKSLGAHVIGVALPAPTQPSLFEKANIENSIDSVIEDIRNFAALKDIFQRCQPEIVFHLAAQSLVRPSYEFPIETYETNVIGSLNVLEAVRGISSVRAVVMVTTDKCYENKEWLWGYREDDALGGHDPYSSSKGCAEILIASHRNSFFSKHNFAEHKTGIASARAGNVIGGGDWATDRLIPDVVNAFRKGDPVHIRNPKATRPWQHVLEPLSGYMLLAENLYSKGAPFAEAWNFGPRGEDAKPVDWVVEKIADLWGDNCKWAADNSSHLYEANYLKLDTSKAQAKLSWKPRWNLDLSLEKTVEWYKADASGQSLEHLCLQQINDFMNTESNE